jgi:putative transposase
LLAGLKLLVPRLKKIWADRAYSGEELARWCEEEGGWELEVVEQNRGAPRFQGFTAAVDSGTNFFVVGR